MSDLALFLLGTPHIERNGEAIHLHRRKAVALLAYLVMTGRAHERDSLAALLWPDLDQSDGRAALRRHLWTLNEALDNGIEADEETIRLGENAIWLDVASFRNLLALCQTHGHPESAVCDLCLKNMTDATDLYHGDLLAGFTIPDCPEFEEWQFFETEALRRDYASVLSRLVRFHSANQDFEQAVSYAQRWLSLDPLREDVHRQLMQLYDWSGQRNAALRQYEVCTKLLQEELRVRPENETTRLYEAIHSGNRPPLPFLERNQPEVHYARSGDYYIAYQVYGEGPVALVWIAGFVTHLEHAWKEPRLVEFRNRLASVARLVVFDKRGRGLSDRVPGSPTAEEMVKDTLAVMDAAGVQRGILLGTSEGGAIAALLAATNPDRISGLILYGAFVKGTQSSDYPWAPPLAFWDRWQEMMVETWGKPQALHVFAPSLASDAQFQRWWAEFLRMGASPGDIVSILDIERGLDVRDALSQIQAPTLILHRRGDKAILVGSGRYLAAHIPNAKYVELDGEDHFWWVGDVDSLLAEIERFLGQI